MIASIDNNKKTLSYIWTVDDVKAVIKDKAKNGWEFQPSLTDDELFDVLKEVEHYRATCEPDESVSYWSIIEALERLYIKREVQTNGEGDAVA